MLLSDRDIKNEADLYTEQIFNVKNCHYLEGKVSRLVADYNRAPDHIEMEYQLAHDGVVVSVNEDCKKIYKTPPSMEQIQKRIAKYHLPFHEKIEQLKPKICFIVDGHSLRSVGPETKDDRGKQRADIIIGNRDYTTCTRAITLKVLHYFKELGYSVTINDPYAGKYNIGNHCSRTGVSGLQIEVNRRLYMNEKTLNPKKRDIARLNKEMHGLAEMLYAEINASDLGLIKL